MPPQERADRIVIIDERVTTTTLEDIEHIESTWYSGIAAIRIFFQPDVCVEGGIGENTVPSQAILRPLLTGIFPPGGGARP